MPVCFTSNKISKNKATVHWQNKTYKEKDWRVNERKKINEKKNLSLSTRIVFGVSSQI